MQSVAIAVAVVQREGRVLIGRRPPHVPLAGLWEFPGGKIGPGETPSEAAARECREETGLEVHIGEAYRVVEHQYKHARVRIHFFAAEPVDSSSTPRTPFCWVPLTTLREYAFPPANAAILADLLSRTES